MIANRAAERLLGYAPGEMAGRALADLYPPEEGRAAAARAMEAARTEDRVEDDGWRRAPRRFAPARVLRARRPPRDVDGGAAGFALEMHAARVRPQVEAELRARLAREEEARERAEEASRARDEFLATLSHELRTPLTAIMGWAHLLRTGNLDEASRERALETIERNAHLEAQLTADILDVARIITGKLRLQIQGVEAAQIVEAAVESVRQQRGGQAHRAAASASDGGRGAIAADPDRLQQVVGNLLTNADQVHPRRWRGARPRGRAARTASPSRSPTPGKASRPTCCPTSSSGSGRAGPRARGKGGLGLGLAIVHHIVELHSGQRARGERGRGPWIHVHRPASLARASGRCRPWPPPRSASILLRSTT